MSSKTSHRGIGKKVYWSLELPSSFLSSFHDVHHAFELLEWEGMKRGCKADENSFLEHKIW